MPSNSTAKVGSAKDLEAFPKLALADPAAVPAGVYAKKWLTEKGVWSAIEPKVIPTLDVRAALAAVAGGDIPAGIVYRTDAAISKDVRIAYTVTDGPSITYSVAPITSSKHPEAASKFVAFLDSPAGRAIFEKRGFLIKPAVLTSDDLSILLLTVRVAAVATLLILPLGIGAAWLLARRGGAWRTLAETLLSLPLVLPPTAVGILLLDLLRRRGPLGGLLSASTSRSSSPSRPSSSRQPSWPSRSSSARPARPSRRSTGGFRASPARSAAGRSRRFAA